MSTEHPQTIGDYVILDKIGSGNFAKVYSAHRKETRNIVAIKALPKANLRSQKQIDCIQREIDSMTYLKFDRIVHLHDLLDDDENFYLVMDFCPGGDLLTYIRTHPKLDEAIAALIFKQVACAVAYCHSFGVAHRDIKPENILIDEFPSVKLTDFGLCGFVGLDSLMRTFCGSMLSVAFCCHFESAATTREAIQIFQSRPTAAAREGNADRGRVPATLGGLALGFMSA
jgi:serine/threonine protein kinase